MIILVTIHCKQEIYVWKYLFLLKVAGVLVLNLTLALLNCRQRYIDMTVGVSPCPDRSFDILSAHH